MQQPGTLGHEIATNCQVSEEESVETGNTVDGYGDRMSPSLIYR